MAVAIRAFLGILTGLATAFAGVVLVELFSAVVHPLPADFDGSSEQMCAHVARYPQWVLAVVVPMWALAAAGATWVAGRIGHRIAAIVVGALLLAALLLNVAMLPYPAWFKVVIVLAVAAAIAGGMRLSRRVPRLAEPNAE